MASKLWYLISFITLGASIFACIFWFINDLPVGIKAMGICLILVAIVISGAIFYFITNRYPRNDTKEYFCNFKTAKFISDEMGCYRFVLEKAEEKGVWIMRNGEVFLRFDMRGYMFPKAYICTFFIRNIHYITLNALHLRFFRLFFPIKLDDKNKYKDVKLIFRYGKKETTCCIVKNGKSKISFLRYAILSSPYQSLYDGLIFKRVNGEMNDEYYKKGVCSVEK